MNSWNELIITVSTKDLAKAEAIATVIAEGGIYVEDYSDMLVVLPTIGHYDYISEELLERDKTLASIHIYINEGDTLKEVIEFVEERLKNEEISFTKQFRVVEDTDWEEGWKQYFHPLHIGTRLVICPTWEQYSKEKDEVVIFLDPGMSFGTGDHESTQLALTLVEECSLEGKEILDIGCGSGILAIAALKLGAKTVTGIDINPLAVEISMSNATINGVDSRYSSHCLDVTNKSFSSTIPSMFDLITANVVADFHIHNSLLFYEKLRTNGKIILSGIIDKQLDEVKLAIEKTGFNILDTRLQNSWCSIVAEKV